VLILAPRLPEPEGVGLAPGRAVVFEGTRVLPSVAMTKLLTESVLRRLTAESFVTYLGHAETFESGMHPGVSSALTGEPVADLNYVVAGRGANHSGHFGAACTACISRDLPFLAIIFPEAGDAVERTAADLGLVYAVDFPFMVRDDAPIEPDGNDSVEVRRAVGTEGADANTRVLSSAFSLPEDSARRALPASVLDAPNLDVFLAFAGDDVVGTVTVIHQGDTSGIWSMATDSTRQRSGIGRQLLSTAMTETRMQGARRFFLGATPAGYRLYESLGFTTRVVARVWASGETHQG
jgi:ribosomal protein S18 acetylase RimI-like enzyme